LEDDGEMNGQLEKAKLPTVAGAEMEAQKILLMIVLLAWISSNATGLEYWKSEYYSGKTMPPETEIVDAPDRDNFARGKNTKCPFTVISDNCVISVSSHHWSFNLPTNIFLGTDDENVDYRIVEEMPKGGFEKGHASVFKVERISEPYSVPFSKWIEIYDKYDEAGKEILLSGYGPIRILDDETYVESIISGAWEHHWGKNKVKEIDEYGNLIVIFDPVGEPGYIEYEARVRSYDSGTAQLIKDNNQWKLAGIASSTWGRMGDEINLIHDFIEEAAEIQNLNKKYYYDTIQDAINEAGDGDVIELPRGTYTENIDFLGKAITLQSRDPNSSEFIAATIIEGAGIGDTVTFSAEPGAGASLRGITITCSDGDGIFCSSAAPAISNCIIRNCANAGIYCDEGASATIRNNKIYDNTEGIHCRNATSAIKNSIIYGNDHGVKLQGGTDASVIVNNTIAVNTKDGIGKNGPATPAPTITNCILWGNGDDLFEDFSASYSWFTIDGDPLFVDPDGADNISGNGDDDYHLTSDSPCINAGAPDYVPDAGQKDIDGGLRVVGGIIDMGAYEQQLYVLLDLDKPWIYQNLPFSTSSQLTADVSVTYDPLSNTSYTYRWVFELPDDVSVVPSTVSGGGLNDTSWTFMAPTCNEPNGLSDSGRPITVKVTVTGDEYGNTIVARARFGIALLGDVNNDGVVNVADRSIINAFWRLDAAGPFTFTDCNVNCDTAVNIADRSIVNAVWLGVLGRNSVGSPCPFR
jgi:parallel beta-helix repeat protein